MSLANGAKTSALSPKSCVSKTLQGPLRPSSPFFTRHCLQLMSRNQQLFATVTDTKFRYRAAAARRVMGKCKYTRCGPRLPWAIGCLIFLIFFFPFFLFHLFHCSFVLRLLVPTLCRAPWNPVGRERFALLKYWTIGCKPFGQICQSRHIILW